MNESLSIDVASQCQVFADEIRKWLSSEIKLRVMFSPDDEFDLTCSDQCLGHQFAARFEADCFRLIAALRFSKHPEVAAGLHHDFCEVVSFLKDKLTPVVTSQHLVRDEELRTVHATVIPFEETYLSFDRTIATPMDKLLLVLMNVARILSNEIVDDDLVAAEELSEFAGYETEENKMIRRFTKDQGIAVKIPGGNGQGRKTFYSYTDFIQKIRSIPQSELKPKIRKPAYGQWPETLLKLREILAPKKFRVSSG